MNSKMDAKKVKVTITEALAEIKTIDKRLAKKREFVVIHLYRQDFLKDPLQSDGGSVEVLRRERQAISDLEERKVVIRHAIRLANEITEISVGGVTRTIADWLVWKREVAPQVERFLSDLNRNIRSVRQEAQRKSVQVVSSERQVVQNSNDIIVNVNESTLAAEIEALEEILGNLDGQLSLKNATTFVEF